MATAENDLEAKAAMPPSRVRRRWRQALWNKQKRRCYYCEIALAFGKATLDHIVPKSKGGPWRKSNMVVACEPCNARRGDMDFEDFVRLAKG